MSTHVLVKVDETEGGEGIRMSREQAMLCNLLSVQLEEEGEEGMGVEPVLYISTYKSDNPEITTRYLMEQAVRYMNIVLHDAPVEIERPLRSSEAEKVMAPSQVEFIRDFSHKQKRQLLLFANFLDFKQLQEVMGAAVALLIKGDQREEAKQAWGATSDENDSVHKEQLVEEKEKQDEEEQEEEEEEDDEE
jgi:hypothetical protein